MNYNIIDGENNVVGTVNNSGVITSDDLNMECPLYFVQDAIFVSGSLYDIATDAQYVTDVWLDYLHATRGVHWEFESPRTINVLSPVSDETLVRAAYVTEVA